MNELQGLIGAALEDRHIDALFHYGYQHGINMYEIWNDDNTEMIGFGIEDDVYYFNQEG